MLGYNTADAGFPNKFKRDRDWRPDARRVPFPGSRADADAGACAVEPARRIFSGQSFAFAVAAWREPAVHGSAAQGVSAARSR